MNSTVPVLEGVPNNPFIGVISAVQPSGRINFGVYQADGFISFTCVGIRLVTDEEKAAPGYVRPTRQYADWPAA